MNRFWTGVTAAPCPHCSQSLEFAPSYATRAQISNEIFRYSILTMLLLVAVRVATDIDEPGLVYVFGVAVIGAIGGILGSATRTVQIQVSHTDDA